MPRDETTPTEFKAGLTKIINAAGFKTRPLTPLEEIDFTMIQTMYPRDKLFRKLSQLFLLTYAQIRESEELLKFLTDMLDALGEKASRLKGD